MVYKKSTLKVEVYSNKSLPDGDYSHEIKRHLLDSILKSRDITLPTKVHLFKAMVFPVVMYGYENLTIKKAEPVLLHCGVGEDT